MEAIYGGKKIELTKKIIKIKKKKVGSFPEYIYICILIFYFYYVKFAFLSLFLFKVTANY